VGAVATIGGWVTGGPTPVARAADGGSVRLGRLNRATAPTRLVAEAETALLARVSASGAVALDGISPTGTGVHGISRDGNGVSGESVFGTGVSGHSIEPGSAAVSGDSTSGVGVQGGSHDDVGVQGTSQYGVAVRGANISDTAPAVQGWAQNAQTGVMGRSGPLDDLGSIPSPKLVGVFGVADAAGGTGVLARSREGLALHARGRVRFTTSGLVTIVAGASQAVVTPAFRIGGSAMVIATPQGDPGNAATVRFVAVDPEADAFTIHMSAAVAVATPVAWFLLE
jgi:hypothetical protein